MADLEWGPTGPVAPGFDPFTLAPKEEHTYRVLATRTATEILIVTANSEDEARQKAIEGNVDDSEFGETLSTDINEIEEI